MSRYVVYLKNWNFQFTGVSAWSTPLVSFLRFMPPKTSSLILNQKRRLRLGDLKLNYGVMWIQTERWSVAYVQRLHEKVAFVTQHANYRVVVGTKETFKKKLVHLVFHVALNKQIVAIKEQETWQETDKASHFLSLTCLFPSLSAQLIISKLVLSFSLSVFLSVSLCFCHLLSLDTSCWKKPEEKGYLLLSGTVLQLSRGWRWAVLFLLQWKKNVSKSYIFKIYTRGQNCLYTW